MSLVEYESNIVRDDAYVAQLAYGIWPRSVPLWVTAFWMALFIIRPQEYLWPGLANYRIELIYTIFAVTVVACCGQFRLPRSFQITGVWLFAAALLISTALAYDFSLAWTQFYRYLPVLVLFVVMLSVIRDSYQLSFIILCYIAIMTAYLGKSEWEYFVNNRHSYTMGVARLQGIEGTYGAPNALASCTVLTLPMVSFLWACRKHISRTWPALYQKALAPALIAYFLLACLAVVLTNSRAGIIGLTAFLAFSVVHRGNLRHILFGLLGAAIVLATIWSLAPESNKERIRTIWDPESGRMDARGSMEGREASFWAGINMFSESPLTGVGIGCFLLYRIERGDGDPTDAHNFYGEILGTTGIFGTAAFLTMLIGLLGNIRRTQQVATFFPSPSTETLARLATSCRIGALLLLLSGVSGAGVLRFHWLWIVAFAQLCRMFAEDFAEEEALATG